MKSLLGILALIVATALAYRIHRDHFEKAIAEARALVLSEAAARAPKKQTPKQVNGVALARNFESLYTELFADLDTSRPADLVPPLEITRERILDRKPRVDVEKQAIYDLGASVANAMIIAAEERTNALDALMRNVAKGRGSLDSQASERTSGDFFASTTMKRWEQERKRLKPSVDVALTRLRSAEREWNARADPNTQLDDFDLPALAPVYVSADKAIGSRSSLEAGSYNRSSTYSWRRGYYERYGY